MGTRALIGYLDTNGDTRLTSTYNHYARLTSTYNHYDGYPGNLGKGLGTLAFTLEITVNSPNQGNQGEVSSP